MTRKEITEGLKLLEDNMVYFDELLNDKGKWIDVHELLFEAIEALSAEPCEDCISRAEVMKLSQHKPEYGDMIYAFDVSILPSVQPIRPKGDISVIEDIKAEIDSLQSELTTDMRRMIRKNRVMDILDKHIADMRGAE